MRERGEQHIVAVRQEKEEERVEILELRDGRRKVPKGWIECLRQRKADLKVEKRPGHLHGQKKQRDDKPQKKPYCGLPRNGRDQGVEGLRHTRARERRRRYR